jgi:hypothetical protein
MTKEEKQTLETISLQLKEMKEDISELKAKLLDPEDGVIVKTNQNTWWRKEVEPLVKEIPDLIQFKKTTYRILWIIVTAVVALVVRVISMHS